MWERSACFQAPGTRFFFLKDRYSDYTGQYGSQNSLQLCVHHQDLSLCMKLYPELLLLFAPSSQTLRLLLSLLLSLWLSQEPYHPGKGTYTYENLSYFLFS